MELSDGDLVRAARAGRGEAFGTLVRRYWRRVRSVCIARVGAAGPADDLAQEAFLKALRRLDALEDPGRFGAWVLGIAVHLALDWRKASARTEVALDPARAPVGCGGAPDHAAFEQEERRRLVTAAVMALPEIYRDTVVLFYFEKQSYGEMARLLGVTPAAINARLHRARALLRERLGAACEP